MEYAYKYVIANEGVANASRYPFYGKVCQGRREIYCRTINVMLIFSKTVVSIMTRFVEPRCLEQSASREGVNLVFWELWPMLDLSLWQLMAVPMLSE